MPRSGYPIWIAWCNNAQNTKIDTFSISKFNGLILWNITKLNMCYEHFTVDGKHSAKSLITVVGAG